MHLKIVTDRTPDFYEIDVPADRPGVAMRRLKNYLTQSAFREQAQNYFRPLSFVL